MDGWTVGPNRNWRTQRYLLSHSKERNVPVHLLGYRYELDGEREAQMYSMAAGACERLGKVPVVSSAEDRAAPWICSSNTRRRDTLRDKKWLQFVCENSNGQWDAARQRCTIHPDCVPSQCDDTGTHTELRTCNHNGTCRHADGLAKNAVADRCAQRSAWRDFHANELFDLSKMCNEIGGTWADSGDRRHAHCMLSACSSNGTTMLPRPPSAAASSASSASPYLTCHEAKELGICNPNNQKYRKYYDPRCPGCCGDGWTPWTRRRGDVKTLTCAELADLVQRGNMCNQARYKQYVQADHMKFCDGRDATHVNPCIN